MGILGHPAVVITLFALFICALAALGVYFAVKGARESSGKPRGFSDVGAIETLFRRFGRTGERRNMIYICVSLENARSLYSDAKARRIHEDIKLVLLDCFATGEDGKIAVCDQKNFLVLNALGEDEVQRRIERAGAEISHCALQHGAVNSISAHFGWYCASSNQVNCETALRRAKQACTFAETEKLPFALWNGVMGRWLEKKVELENSIESEIENNRFLLRYQPIVDAATKQMRGAEVLSQLNSEKIGMLKPGHFLPAVNNVKLNPKFDYYIFEKNCTWISHDKARREVYRYTVNFSRRTLCEPNAAERLLEIAAQYGIRTSALAVEVLEDAALGKAETEQMMRNLRLLQSKGISVALDDFGHGYTTFSDIRNFAPDIIKIDKSITQSTDTAAGLSIFKNIVRMAKEVGAETVCEGIETPEQEKVAVEAGCDMLQGFYYSLPLPALQMEKRLEQNEPAAVS